MSRAEAIHVKARAILRDRGHVDGDTREYQDWHIEIRSGASYVAVWSSAGMVFLSLSGIPVFHRPGPWEQYVDRLFHRLPLSDRGSEPA